MARSRTSSGRPAPRVHQATLDEKGLASSVVLGRCQAATSPCACRALWERTVLQAKAARRVTLVNSPTWVGLDATSAVSARTLRMAPSVWSVIQALSRPKSMMDALSVSESTQQTGANACCAVPASAQMRSSVQRRACSARTSATLPSALTAWRARTVGLGTNRTIGLVTPTLCVFRAPNVAWTGSAVTATSAPSARQVLSQTSSAQAAFSASPQGQTPTLQLPMCVPPWAWSLESVAACLLQILRCAQSLVLDVPHVRQAKSLCRTGRDASRVRISAMHTCPRTVATVFDAPLGRSQMPT